MASVGVLCTSTGTPFGEASGWAGCYREEMSSTFGFQLNQVGWCFNPLDTFFGPSEEAFMSERELVTPPNTLALIFCDRLIVVEFCLLFDVLHKQPRSSLLKGE